jgi:hypothetical protein
MREVVYNLQYIVNKNYLFPVNNRGRFPGDIMVKNPVRDKDNHGGLYIPDGHSETVLTIPASNDVPTTGGYATPQPWSRAA